MQKPTRDEISEWQVSPVTKYMLYRCKEAQEFVKERLDSGNTLHNEVGLTAQVTARAVGEIAGLEYIIAQEFFTEEE